MNRKSKKKLIQFGCFVASVSLRHFGNLSMLFLSSFPIFGAMICLKKKTILPCNEVNRE